MMLVAKVNEGSRLPLEIELRDYTNAAVVPTTLRYRIDCDTTGKALVAWTTLSPASSISLTVPASANAIQNRCNPTEIKVITFEADAGTDNAFTSEHKWQVINLRGIG